MRKGMVKFLCGGLLTFGCASQSTVLKTKEPVATQTALTRGRFEMNCPTATAVILSQDYIQPPQARWGAVGITREEYTIGVEGCDKKDVYVVLCQEGTESCFASHRNDVNQAR